MLATLQAPTGIYLTVSEGRERVSFPVRSLSPDHIEQTLEMAQKRLIREALESDQD
jgi:hypothetical protein